MSGWRMRLRFNSEMLWLLAVAALIAGCAPWRTRAESVGTTAARRETATLVYRTGPERWNEIRAQLVALVNAGRRDAGLPELPADPAAMRFAQAEAERLVASGTFSHHAADGSKPYQRWSRAGGLGHVRENIYRFKAVGQKAYMLFDARQAHDRLMDSEGHRRTILDPASTSVGIGIAFDRERNTVYVTQEFLLRYVALEPGSPRWRTGETRRLRGRVLAGAWARPSLAVLYREAKPGSREARRLQARSSYREGAPERVLVLSGRAFSFDAATGEFALTATVPPQAHPGPHTLMLFVHARRSAEGRGSREAREMVPAASLEYQVVRGERT